MDKDNKISRRKWLEKLPHGVAALGLGGFLWGSLLKDATSANPVLRPPGALPEKSFVKACLKCGQCVVACPYDTLKLAPASDAKLAGTPFFEAREIPCYMCTDYPCIIKCPSKALTEEAITKEGKASINNAEMGLAIVHKETCIAFWGIQCDACYRACPLMGEAISLEFEKNEVTGKHANLKPVVNSDVCTGCGMCEQVCVVEKAAIKVLPRDIATGEVGDHYLKSWDKSDEERLKKEAMEKKKAEDSESAIDYLNADDLIDNE
ncbi:ferredoxin-type protein NapG [Prolixibacteraceae bacterium Z1-6]|uniref:Ferredoxin-type protein NapG n=1 Tax=Draconibacterium aestuarii TaxID=2998507 RepID=A0A9X3F5Z6_9BACT|nr:ferredoxin-type protein NapG [Prolixibacteraceae bacterium Z1-6]